MGRNVCIGELERVVCLIVAARLSVFSTEHASDNKMSDMLRFVVDEVCSLEPPSKCLHVVPQSAVARQTWSTVVALFF